MLYLDEALETIRRDSLFDLPVKRTIRRQSWTDRWIEWRDSKAVMRYDALIRPRTEYCEYTLTMDDLSAKDWEVDE